MIEQHKKIVFILRDPRDLLVSMFLYMYRPAFSCEAIKRGDKAIQAIELLCEKVKNPGKISLRDTLAKYSLLVASSLEADVAKNQNWKNVLDDIMLLLNFMHTYKDKAVVLKYEDFVRNNLAPVEKFLDLKLHYEPLPKNERGGYHFARDGSPGNWKKWFTLEDALYYQDLLAPWAHELPYDLTEMPPSLTFDPQLLKSTLEYVLYPFHDCAKKNPECAKVMKHFREKYPEIEFVCSLE